jgi:hypothetical protein
VINQGLKEMMATQTWQANERRIAEAELRRRAKAGRPPESAPSRAAAAIGVGSPFLSAVGSLVGACRALGRGLIGLVLGDAPA